MSHTFALLVPVKTLSLAKTRLTSLHAGDPEPLMRAFALDAITAAIASPAVAQVHVVTDDRGFAVPGTRRLPDEGDGDLNGALVHASRRVRLEHPGLAIVAMCADLPSLRTADLTDALSAGMSHDGSWPTPTGPVRRCWQPDPGSTSTHTSVPTPRLGTRSRVRCRSGLPWPRCAVTWTPRTTWPQRECSDSGSTPWWRWGWVLRREEPADTQKRR